MSDITLMLDAVAQGKKQASADLLPLVYVANRKRVGRRGTRLRVGELRERRPTMIDGNSRNGGPALGELAGPTLRSQAKRPLSTFQNHVPT